VEPRPTRPTTSTRFNGAASSQRRKGEYKKRVRKFKAKQVLEADIAEAKLDEASTLLRKQLEAA
jgi:hypothetical protein